MFLPGETVVHEFIIPISNEQIQKVIVTYEQNDHIILEKPLNTASVMPDPEGAKISYTLSQEESLLFASPIERKCLSEKTVPYKVQLNIYTKGGARATSVPLEGRTGVQHVREVIANG